MLNNKIKYILVLFIILSLSMNAFSATNFADDSSDAAPQSSSVDEVVGDGDGTGDDTGDGAGDDTGDGTDSQDNNENGDSDNTNTDDNKPGKSTFGGNGSGFNFGNGTGFGGNGSDFDIASLLDFFTKMMGGDNATNATNETVNPEVSDVPRVVTSTSYAPASPTVGQSSHVIQRLRDNKTISEGNSLTLDDLNKLFDSNFTNGHLLVYVDGKLVFNEITAGDLSTSLFQITDEYIGQHQITVEFTPNGSSDTNKYTEDVLII